MSQAYEVQLYRGLLGEAWTETPAAPMPWPWDDLATEDFTGDGFAVAYLTPEQVAQLADVPNGGQGFITLELPDGTIGSLTVSPVLPDQLVVLDGLS